MADTHGPRPSLIAPNLLALATGIASSPILVSAHTFLSGYRAARAAHVQGDQLLVLLTMQWQLAFWTSTIYAVIIATPCVPVWLLLMKFGLNRAPSAIALGFLATMTGWVLLNLNDRGSVTALLSTGLPYAICGAISGYIVWTCRPNTARPS